MTKPTDVSVTVCVRRITILNLYYKIHKTLNKPNNTKLFYIEHENSKNKWNNIFNSMFPYNDNN
jgi:hypothetical protein